MLRSFDFAFKRQDQKIAAFGSSYRESVDIHERGQRLVARATGGT